MILSLDVHFLDSGLWPQWPQAPVVKEREEKEHGPAIQDTTDRDHPLIDPAIRTLRTITNLSRQVRVRTVERTVVEGTEDRAEEVEHHQVVCRQSLKINRSLLQIPQWLLH